MPVGKLSLFEGSLIQKNLQGFSTFHILLSCQMSYILLQPINSHIFFEALFGTGRTSFTYTRFSIRNILLSRSYLFLYFKTACFDDQVKAHKDFEYYPSILVSEIIIIKLYLNQQIKMRSRMLLVYFLMNFAVHFAFCADCIYNPSNFSVTSQMPVNPLTNCLEYCRSLYAETPQRAYYNVSSQNCEPVRFCNYTESIYNYATNRCYNDEQFTIENASYIPKTIERGVIVIGATNASQMVCVNGYNYVEKLGLRVCSCKLLWEHSGKVDMNGFAFKCDVVTTQPERHFYKQLQIDPTTAKIIKYGPFKASQMEVLLKNLKALQYEQQRQLALNQTQPVLYAIRTSLPNDPFISTSEYPVLGIGLLMALIIFSISYWEYQKLRIKITSSKLRQKIVQTLKENHLVREIP